MQAERSETAQMLYLMHLLEFHPRISIGRSHFISRFPAMYSGCGSTIASHLSTAARYVSEGRSCRPGWDGIASFLIEPNFAGGHLDDRNHPAGQNLLKHQQPAFRPRVPQCAGGAKYVWNDFVRSRQRRPSIHSPSGRQLAASSPSSNGAAGSGSCHCTCSYGGSGVSRTVTWTVCGMASLRNCIHFCEPVGQNLLCQNSLGDPDRSS